MMKLPLTRRSQNASPKNKVDYLDISTKENSEMEEKRDNSVLVNTNKFDDLLNEVSSLNSSNFDLSEMGDEACESPLVELKTPWILTPRCVSAVQGVEE